MKLYLDTADRGAAESLMATGLFTGVTTNPTILQRASKGVADVGDIYRWAIEAGAEEVFFQSWGEDRATYIAPYLGRLNDAGRDGIAEVLAMQEVLAATGSPTKVLLASIRSVPDMVALARRGVDCFTMGPSVAEQFFTDPTTAEAARTFEDAVRETSA